MKTGNWKTVNLKNVKDNTEFEGQIIRIKPSNFHLIFPFTGTRKISKAHKTRIKEGIELIGFVGCIPAVMEENKLMLLDGHHRFEALKELQVPVNIQIIKCVEFKNAVPYFAMVQHQMNLR